MLLLICNSALGKEAQGNSFTCQTHIVANDQNVVANDQSMGQEIDFVEGSVSNPKNVQTGTNEVENKQEDIESNDQNLDTEIITDDNSSLIPSSDQENTKEAYEIVPVEDLISGTDPLQTSAQVQKDPNVILAPEQVLKYKCILCKEIFQEEDHACQEIAKKSVVVQTKIPFFPCHICYKKFAKWKLLKRHECTALKKYVLKMMKNAKKNKKAKE